MELGGLDVQTQLSKGREVGGGGGGATVIYGL